MIGLEGKTLGHYELRRMIGKGGMANVYEGYDTQDQRLVAVKIFKRDNEDMLLRFIRESELMLSLSHERLVRVYDAGESQVDGTTLYYMVMPLMDGGTLRKRIRSSPLSLKEVCRNLGDIAAALDYIHSHGVIHRDIKASNILLDLHGQCYLSDFGIARAMDSATHLTSTGDILGTADYVAPELFEVHRKADAHSDLYSLGVLLFEMVTGQLPFTADSPVMLVAMHVSKSPLLPQQLSPQVKHVMLKALGKKPEQRYSSARELAQAFCQAVKSSGKKHVGEESDSAQIEKFLAPVATSLLVSEHPQSNMENIAGVFSAEKGISVHWPPSLLRTTSPLGNDEVKLPPETKRRQYFSQPSRRHFGALVVLVPLALFMLALPVAFAFLLPSNLHPRSTAGSKASPVHGKVSPITPMTSNITATANTVVTTHVESTAAAVNLTATAQASRTAPTLITGKPLLYHDPLNVPNENITQKAGWDQHQIPPNNCAFQGDGYHNLEVISTNVMLLHGCREHTFTYQNVLVTVDMHIIQGFTGGLFFRNSTDFLGINYSGYLFEVDHNGRYRILRVTTFGINSGATVLHDWTFSSALQQGNMAKNTLQVSMQGNTFTFYTNNSFLTALNDGAFPSGAIAFAARMSSGVGATTEVVYSNLNVYALP